MRHSAGSIVTHRLAAIAVGAAALFGTVAPLQAAGAHHAGRLGVGAGERVDRASVRALEPASFVHLPGGMPHYATADVETIVQINGTGPFDVVYVDPKDDPRNR